MAAAMAMAAAGMAAAMMAIGTAAVVAAMTMAAVEAGIRCLVPALLRRDIWSGRRVAEFYVNLPVFVLKAGLVRNIRPVVYA